MAALIHKGGLQALATATFATSATRAEEEGASVARVATVAVAKPREPEAGLLPPAPAWLIHFLERDPLEVHFIPEATHGEVLAAYPDAVAAEPLQIAAPLKSCWDCRHRRRPGLADEGYCARRTDTPRAYGDHHPLHRLLDDGGAGCNSFEDRT